MSRLNPDQDLRALERAARAGDVDALERLAREIERRRSVGYSGERAFRHDYDMGNTVGDIAWMLTDPVSASREPKVAWPHGVPGHEAGILGIVRPVATPSQQRLADLAARGYAISDAAWRAREHVAPERRFNPPQDSGMTVVCAWCNKHMRGAPVGTGRISHGMCPDCLAREIAALPPHPPSDRGHPRTANPELLIKHERRAQRVAALLLSWGWHANVVSRRKGFTVETNAHRSHIDEALRQTQTSLEEFPRSHNGAFCAQPGCTSPSQNRGLYCATHARRKQRHGFPDARKCSTCGTVQRAPEVLGRGAFLCDDCLMTQDERKAQNRRAYYQRTGNPQDEERRELERKASLGDPMAKRRLRELHSLGGREPKMPRWATPRTKRWTTDNTVYQTGFERDRSHVGLNSKKGDKPILDVWDEGVQDLVDAGFLDPKHWHKSMVDYANHLGVGTISERDLGDGRSRLPFRGSQTEIGRWRKGRGYNPDEDALSLQEAQLGARVSAPSAQVLGALAQTFGGGQAFTREKLAVEAAPFLRGAKGQHLSPGALSVRTGHALSELERAGYVHRVGADLNKHGRPGAMKFMLTQEGSQRAEAVSNLGQAVLGESLADQEIARQEEMANQALADFLADADGPVASTTPRHHGPPLSGKIYRPTLHVLGTRGHQFPKAQKARIRKAGYRTCNPDEDLRALEVQAWSGDTSALDRLWRASVQRQDARLAATVERIASSLWARHEAESSKAFRESDKFRTFKGHSGGLPRHPLSSADKSAKKKWDKARSRAFAISKETEAEQNKILPIWRQAESVGLYGIFGGNSRITGSPPSDALRRGFDIGRQDLERKARLHIIEGFRKSGLAPGREALASFAKGYLSGASVQGAENGRLIREAGINHDDVRSANPRKPNVPILLLGAMNPPARASNPPKSVAGVSAVRAHCKTFHDVDSVRWVKLRIPGSGPPKALSFLGLTDKTSYFVPQKESNKFGPKWDHDHKASKAPAELYDPISHTTTKVLEKGTGPSDWWRENVGPAGRWK